MAFVSQADSVQIGVRFPEYGHAVRLTRSRSDPCRRLKRLDLNGLYLDHSFAEKLQSWFPHLEDLILRECRQGFSVLQSDKLKNLDIKQCEYVSSDVFVIRVPALASLHLDIVYCYYKKEAKSCSWWPIQCGKFGADRFSTRGQPCVCAQLS
ncbi:hypothetical protein EJB05_37875, partial [Eragrostis curvula]